MANSSVTYKGLNFFVGDNMVLVKMDKKEEITKSGIIIPTTSEVEEYYMGEVVATGEKMDSKISLGEKVLVPKKMGLESPTDDESRRYCLYSYTSLKYRFH